MRSWLLLIVLVLLFAKVSAFSFETNMDFHASMAGTNVLHPGEKRQITILLECEITGWAGSPLPVNENTSQIIPLLTTAKDVRLEPSASVIRVESDQIVVGDLPCGRVRPVNLVVDVNKDAREGDYDLRLDIHYTKILANIDAGGNVTLNYKTGQTDSVSVEIKIEKKEYDFTIESVSSKLVAGREGVVTIKIKNSGIKTLYDTVLLLNTTPPIMLNPKAMSVYTGDLENGKEVTASFKVYVPDGVFLQSYPAELVAVFRTSSGMPAKISKPLGLKITSTGYFRVEKLDEFLSSAKTLRVEQKIQMPSLSIPIPNQAPKQPSTGTQNVITIPSRGFLAVRITNTGEEIRDAFATLIFDNPLITSASTPYLGDMKRGESRNVTFYITSSAPTGSYLGYIIIKYRDPYGDEVASPKIYVNVDVKPTPALEVRRVETSNLGVGLVGDIKVTLAGEGARNVRLYLISPDSTLSPLSSTSYIENSGEKAVFRVAVSDDATAGNHLLYLVESFDTEYASDLVSVAEFPVYVAPKLATFQVVSVKSDLHPDSTGDVFIEIKNSGNAEIYNAVVMLEVSAPLSVAGTSSLGSMIGQAQPGKYFVGTMKPGDVAKVRFRVDVDKDAGEGSYPASVKIVYYDENGYKHTTNSIVISLDVKPSKPYVLIFAVILAIVGLAIAGSFVRKRRSMNK
ncbi:COG1361 S-layer family protein [Archaeoglobus neptunius]|uniref:COG1361 S-layer family protein n=1 Tax=Archaeoglobus neptunius TaxID=2798580 RepID=UPI0019269D13|nr:COG1361 S-layer family protein [Archaeoglobus neptunius]